MQAGPYMQGHCSGPPDFGLNLDPPRDEANLQCVIIVREDFLELPLRDSAAWISNLYITLPGVEKNHTTLIGVYGGDLYMTAMTFVGDGDKARAIDVKESGRVYVGRASRRALSNTCIHVLNSLNCSGSCRLVLFQVFQGKRWGRTPGARRAGDH